MITFTTTNGTAITTGRMARVIERLERNDDYQRVQYDVLFLAGIDDDDDMDEIISEAERRIGTRA